MATPRPDPQPTPSIAALPPPRPRRGLARVAPPIWLAVFLALVAFVGVLVVTKGAEGVPVAVAARPLVSGEALRRVDLRVDSVSVSATVLRTLIPASDIATIDGRTTIRAIPEGALVTQADIAPAGETAQQRAMSFPISPTRAVGGSLVRGDTVDVIDSSGGQPIYVVTNAKVVAVGDTSGSKIGGGTRDYALTIVVDDAAATRLAAAIKGEDIDVVRSTGAAPAPVSPTPPTTLRRA